MPFLTKNSLVKRIKNSFHDDQGEMLCFSEAVCICSWSNSALWTHTLQLSMAMPRD